MIDWGGYGSVVAAAAEDREHERTEVPVACPNDGTILEERDGVLHCPFDGWTCRS